MSRAKNRSAQKVLRRSLHFSRAVTLKITEIGKYYDIKTLEARGLYHNHKKLIPDFNNLIKEAFNLLEISPVVDHFLFFCPKGDE